MINVAVCDDEPIHRRDAEKRVERILHAEGIAFRLLMFSSAEELLARTEVGEWQPEIAVLDIEMDGEDGISLARKLNEKIPACRIIFFTGYVDHAPEVYVAEHIWFVVKSRADEFLNQLLERHWRLSRRKRQLFLALSFGRTENGFLCRSTRSYMSGRSGEKHR